MFCPKCGSELPAAAAYCPRCGEQSGNPSSREKPLPDTFIQPSTTATITYAGFWVRLAAVFYDSLILNIPTMIFGFIFGLIYYSNNPNAAAKENDSLFNLIGILVAWIYMALMESSSKQATLGKMLLRIKVTDLSGNRLSFGRASGRYFGKTISFMILCIGFLMAGFTSKKQALHDKMAGCLVINNQETKGRKVWMIIALAIMFLLPTGIISSLVLPSYLKQAAHAQVSEVVSLLESGEKSLTEWYATHGYWPEPGRNVPLIGPGKYVESVDLSQSGPGATTPALIVTATLGSSTVAKEIVGKSVQIATNDGGATWSCGAGLFDGVDNKYLPTKCR
ncbi:MAG: RDD family protein [Magnetococcales bacterium]|nr:RDD family protein [Magnetococcales bacterium]MBF0322236.1 RDD family protein [Magnetococcales bacterium]